MSPFERERLPDDQPGDPSGLELDLDERVCEACRRGLPAWRTTCPACGGAAVRLADLPPPDDPLLRRLLDGDDAEAG